MRFGTTNYDSSTGIYYGVISQHSIDPEAFSDIHQAARDLSYESAVDQLKKELRDALEGVMSEHFSTSSYGGRKSKSETATESATDAAWEAIEQEFNDSYESYADHAWLYEKDGYELRDCLTTDIFVIKSPYYTFAPECSPCVPNAGNLDSASDREAASNWEKAYCLHHDFFEGGKAPYPVYSVATGKRIVVVEEESPCPYCNGTGRDSVARIVSVRRDYTATPEILHATVVGEVQRTYGERYDAATETFPCLCGDGKKRSIVYKEVE
jgi:hypothetical protein